jgi:hypothetical protein
MKTLTIELPEGVFEKIAALPREEWATYISSELKGPLAESIMDSINEEIFADWVAGQQVPPGEEAADVVAIVNDAVAYIEAGGRTYSMAEIMARWNLTEEDIRNAPDGIINGQAK